MFFNYDDDEEGIEGMSLPYMPLCVADHLAQTAHLNAAESGAYLHLMMHYWVKGCLPVEDRILARIARMTTRQWMDAKPTIRAFFTEDWRHHELDFVRANAQSKVDARAVSGSRGGTAKALKSKEAALANASDLLQQNPSKTLPIMNQNQKEEERKKETREARALSLERREREIDEVFIRFWERWPHKVGKPAARRAFGRVAGEIDAIIAGIAVYERSKPPDRMWLNPSTFLAQRRWEDTPAAVSPRGANNDKSVVDAGRNLARRLVAEREEREMRAGDRSAIGDSVVRFLPSQRSERS